MFLGLELTEQMENIEGISEHAPDGADKPAPDRTIIFSAEASPFRNSEISADGGMVDDDAVSVRA